MRGVGGGCFGGDEVACWRRGGIGEHWGNGLVRVVSEDL